MATASEEFLATLRATFRLEAEEHLQAISSMLLEMEKTPSARPAPAVVENVYREAHSLKGAARSVDASEIEAICQSMESIFGSWKRELAIPDAKTLDSIHNSLDRIQAMLGGDKSEPVKSAEPAAEPRLPEAEKPLAIQTVRIAMDKLDTQLMKVEEMLSVKGMAADRAKDVRELSGRFESWRRQWGRVSAGARGLRQTLEQTHETETPMVSAGLVDFLEWNADYVRSLEERLLSLVAQTQRDHHAVARHVDDLVEESKKLLTLPFSTISGVFPKLVRDLCRDQNKEADLTITGNEIELDRRILEEIKDALIHILRNCVDHGIESPAQRIAGGKAARAAIGLTVSPTTGGKVEVCVRDDGAGVDIERVKESAVKLGIISAGDAKSLGEREALGLVFHSEVSTTQTVTAISGRGLGMAIVREKTEKLGGRVSIESRRNVGTTLRIVLPVNLATFRGVVVSAGGCPCAVPTRHVERVLRIKPTDIQTVENRETIRVDGRVVALARLDAVLGLATAARDETAKIPVILINSGEQRIAFAVDEILREEEVLVKPLPRPVSRIRNISGVTVLDSGKPMPVLSVTDLIASARAAGGMNLAAVGGTKPVVAAKRILVVEDSITSRMLIKGILESAGYKVQIAVDGVEAFTRLREQAFDLVVSDVEMPRMDGFGLASRIREDKKLCDLPVVLVTALESHQERERGIDAGASAYIVKSSFDQSNLLEAVRRLV